MEDRVTELVTKTLPKRLKRKRWRYKVETYNVP
jgi:hypothetical protein